MQGCSCEFVKADIKTGGSSLHNVTMSNGHEMRFFTKYEKSAHPKSWCFYNTSPTKVAT
jgi:hypothetical protein